MNNIFISQLPTISDTNFRRIAEIEQLCFGDETHPNYCPGVTIGSVRKFKDYFIGIPKSLLFIAYEEQEKDHYIVGYMIVNPPKKLEDDNVWGYCVSNVGIDPQYQGRGICTALIDHLFKRIVLNVNALPKDKMQCKDMDLKYPPKVYLHVRLGNHAKAVYKRCGFKVVKQCEAYYTERKIWIFENRAMLRRYQKKVVAELNKRAFNHYKKRLKGRLNVNQYPNVFSLRLGKDPKSGRPTGQVVGHAERMIIEYSGICDRVAQCEKAGYIIAYKTYPVSNRLVFFGFFDFLFNLLSRFRA